jgi:uncharacterized membrane protein YccC
LSIVQSRPSASEVVPQTGSARLRRAWVDRFLGSDPGLNRFRAALHTMLTIGLVLEAEWLFVHFTHALQAHTHGTELAGAAAARVAIVNHEYVVIAMVLGAIVAMISTFAVVDPTARGQLVTVILLPVAMVPALALGIALGDQRVLALVSLAVLLALGTYCRRFGPRGFIAGMLLFMGDFFGFFLHGAVTIDALGWLTAEIGVGVVGAILVRFVFFYPRQAQALERTQRSYAARARKVAASAVALFDDPEHGEREVRRLQHQLVRLNEAALMIDAQLGDPNALGEGTSAQLLHQRLFDLELALTNIARFAQAMARLDLPDDQRAKARLTLVAIAREDVDGARAHATSLIELLRRSGSVPAGEDRAAIVVPHRFATSVLALTDAMTEWLAIGSTEGASGDFQPSVVLFGGWLPGSTQVSAAASRESGTRRGDRIRLAPYTRTAIQMGIAVGAAIALGDVVSGRRFYWAVIAAFVTFMGVNNSAEQARKALVRVVGTVVGIGVGSLVVDAVGHHTYWSIAVILFSLFLGLYLVRISYAFMVIGITVTVSQLYMQLGEFSNSLLVLRLEETALGAAVAIAVVMLVLPLRTRRVLRVALRDHVQAVEQLVDDARSELLGGHDAQDILLRADARAVDACYQAVVATARPLRRNLLGRFDPAISQVLRLASASRHYSRNLVTDIQATGLLDVDTRHDIERAGATLHESLEVVVGAVNGPRDVVYTRCAALFDRAERRLEERSGVVDGSQLAIRDFKLIDGVMARLAEIMGLRVTDYDTVGV